MIKHTFDYEKKVLEVNENELVEIPLVLYPPFKLRSSMYEQDPVIWVHLLETYIHLFEYFLSLDTISQVVTKETVAQLRLIVGKYIQETSDESNQVLALGLVNSQISSNNRKLYNLIFSLIQKQGLQFFQFSSKQLWCFVQVYLKNELKLVRQLLVSSNAAHGLIGQFQDMIVNKQFATHELRYYASLMGLLEKPNKASQKSINSVVNSIVNLKLIKIFERYYSHGEGIHSNTCKSLMAISLISCSKNKVTSLVNDIYKNLVPQNVYNFVNQYPLLYSILKSDTIEVDHSLEHLFKHNDSINRIIDMFPQLSLYQAKYLLKSNKNDPATVIHKLLEDPELSSEIPKQLEKSTRSKFDDDEFAKLQFNSNNVIFGKKEHSTLQALDESADHELRQKSLQRALTMMYDSGEDEPDDTYEDVEESPETSDTQNIELLLATAYIKDANVGDRSGATRRSEGRKKLLKETGWTHEQIEGFLSMLAKSPKRLKMIEEKILMNNSNKTVVIPRTSFRQKTHDEESEKNHIKQIEVKTFRKQDEKVKPVGKLNDKIKNNEKATKTGGNNTEKNQQRRKEQNKSKKANHNRKAAHDKKVTTG